MPHLLATRLMKNVCLNYAQRGCWCTPFTLSLFSESCSLNKLTNSCNLQPYLQTHRDQHIPTKGPAGTATETTTARPSGKPLSHRAFLSEGKKKANRIKKKARNGTGAFREKKQRVTRMRRRPSVFCRSLRSRKKQTLPEEPERPSRPLRPLDARPRAALAPVGAARAARLLPIGRCRGDAVPAGGAAALSSRLLPRGKAAG